MNTSEKISVDSTQAPTLTASTQIESSYTSHLWVTIVLIMTSARTSFWRKHRSDSSFIPMMSEQADQVISLSANNNRVSRQETEIFARRAMVDRAREGPLLPERNLTFLVYLT